MRTYFLSLCVLIVLLTINAQAQMKVDTTWLKPYSEKDYFSVKQGDVGYKVKETDKRILIIKTYSATQTLESKFELKDKQIEDRRAEHITYLPNGKTRRVVLQWDMDMKQLKRSYYNQKDEYVGTGFYNGVNFEQVKLFVRGTEVLYYHLGGPKHIKTMKNGAIIEEKFFYKNGKLAEHFVLAKNLKHGVSTYYNPNGKEVGMVEYLYNAKRKKKKVKQGNEFIYNANKLLGKKHIGEGGQIEEEVFFTDQKPESLLYLNNIPYDGVQYKYSDHGEESKIVYKEGSKIEEIVFFNNGNIKSQFKDLKTVYYNSVGDTVGIGHYAREKNNVLKLMNGIKVTYSDIYNVVLKVEHRELGNIVRRDKYRLTEDWKSSFIFESNFTTPDRKRNVMNYYSTGQPKFRRQYIDNQEIFTTFNIEGDTIGVFNASKKDGTKYSFFGLRGYYDYMSKVETYTNGSLEYLKKWYIPIGKVSDQSDLQLLYDYDYKGKARTYDSKGELMYTMQMQNLKPWNGQWEEHQYYGGADIMYTYVGGEKHGEYKKYSRFGLDRQIAETGQMVSGEIEGVRKYYRDSKLYKTDDRKIHNRHGKVKFYTNGKVWKEELYGEKITKQTEFDSNGKVSRTLDYKFGEPYNGIGITKISDYKNSAYKRMLTKYIDGKTFRVYKYYDKTIYSVFGRSEDNSKTAFYNAETDEKYADRTWNKYKRNSIDSVTYYNAKGKPFLQGQFKKSKLLNGHLILQAYTRDLDLNLIHIVKNDKETTITIFDSQANVIMSNYMANNDGVIVYLKKYFGKNFKINIDMFALDSSFLKFIQSKAFLKKYVI